MEPQNISFTRKHRDSISIIFAFIITYTFYLILQGSVTGFGIALLSPIILLSVFLIVLISIRWLLKPIGITAGQEKEGLIMAEKEKILQENSNELFKKFNALNPEDNQNLIKEATKRVNKKIENKRGLLFLLFIIIFGLIEIYKASL